MSEEMRFEPRLPEEGINVSKTHPLNDAATLIFGLIAVFVGLLLAVGWAVDLAAGWIPPETEMALFEPLHFEVLADASANPERSAEVQALVDRLAAHWPDSGYTFQVAVIDSDEPNAMALPGGTILVTSALYESAESENELAFVLGHELGHFRHRDHLRSLGRGMVFGLGMAMLGMGGTVPDLASVTGELTLNTFGRDQERDADAFGLELVHAEYGHIASSWTFFQRLSEDAPFEAVIAYLSTHPASVERIELLKELALEKGWTMEGAVRAR